MPKFLTALLLAVLLPSVAAANCLPTTQNLILGVQMANAYSISQYGWQGDRWYDQVMPRCGSHPGAIEFGCNLAFNAALRYAEDRVARDVPDTALRRGVCTANVLGAIAFGFYIRNAVWVQIFHRRF